MTLSASSFQKTLLAWFDQHGRKSLPWQIDKTPYRVWVSEIMLQQTQVATVIGYFDRFMSRFPTIAALAEAPEDDVLHLWAGLGYYSRARNLHRAAKTIVNDYASEFPNTLETLKKLPGIGPSTAGAILSIAFNQPAPILDGNVKRVLARLYGITDPVNNKATESLLWELAVNNTPKHRIADYTQAIMDLGATLCTQSKPACERCPFIKRCIAYKQEIVTLVPAKTATRKIPTRTATFLLLRHNDTILLYKRPSTGIWGGLFSLPEMEGKPELEKVKTFCKQRFQLPISTFTALTSFRHTFSHYHLNIHPVLLTVKRPPLQIMEDHQQIWYNLLNPEAVGLPKPVQSILRGLS